MFYVFGTKFVAVMAQSIIRMKTRIVYLLFALLGGISLMAQQAEGKPQRTPQQIAERQTERLQRDVNLTEQQRDTVYAIHLKYAERRRENEDRSHVMIRMDSLREDLKGVLTDEQFKLLQQKRRETGPQRQATVRMVQQEAVTDTVKSE